MISRLRGTLLPRDAGLPFEAGSVEIALPTGITYRVEIPRSVAERLPQPGEVLELRIHHLIRDDGETLYGFLSATEEALFRVLLMAQGVGAKKALGMLSTYPAPRLARALAERDIAALAQIPGLGRKTAEKVALDLSDRVRELGISPAEGTLEGGTRSRAQEAVQALLSLGMTHDEADAAIRLVLESEPEASTEHLIRSALARK
jgi:holliday junction DNA helicase RuvA